jgi:hypothetical protein
MRRAPALVLVLAPLALGGCAWFGGDDRSEPAETRPEYLACRHEVRDSDEMRALAAESNPNNALNYGRVQTARRQTESRLYRECLRRRGLALPGGVEAIRLR